ncbi:TniB family NTP-binding protein [Deinococcus pimensis]|uniref:TniB family NTP-binding protein n=1 Tax=Deinococcus pimensis TaxID=309888 RepID=UPI000482D625|nr:TniB family NTP-binding protein [Deinococcus pimensis]
MQTSKPTKPARPPAAARAPKRREQNDIIRDREANWWNLKSRKKVVTLFQSLVKTPDRHRRRAPALIAGPNEGKTRLVRFLRDEFKVERVNGSLVVKIVYVNMADVDNVAQLMEELLRALGDVDPTAGNAKQRYGRFRELARMAQLAVIFLDEFHDSVDATGKGKPFLRAIKKMMNDEDAKFVVIPMGIPELAGILRRDKQLATRFSTVTGRLPRLKDLGEVKTIMQDLVGPGHPEVEDECVLYAAAQTKGVLGHLLDLVESALVIGNDRLTLKNLKEARNELRDVLDDLDES